MAKYLDSAGVTRLVTKLKTDVIPSVKVNAAKAADTVPASGITGVIDISHIPQGALERVVTVADDTARYKLTTSQVQLGDTVKVTATGRMYIVVDESKLSTSAGYMEYAAGTAASVPWSGVTGKPSTFTPSSHNHTMKLKIGATTKDGSTSGTTSWSKQDIIGTPSVSGSGNAVTGMTVSGDTVTLTKGTTFATKAQNDALDTRISALEDFTGGTGGGLGDQLNVAGYDVVRFDGFLASKPTLQQTSATSVVALVIVKSPPPAPRREPWPSTASSPAMVASTTATGKTSTSPRPTRPPRSSFISTRSTSTPPRARPTTPWMPPRSRRSTAAT